MASNNIQTQLNDAQRDTVNRRAKRGSSTTVPSAGEKIETRKAYRLEDIAADGNEFNFAGEKYYVTRFPVMKMKHAGLLMTKVPIVVTVCAGAYDPDTSTIDFDKAAAIYNQNARTVALPEGMVMDAYGIEYLLGTIPTFLAMSDEDVAELTIRALTDKEVEELTVEDFLKIESENFQKRLQVPSIVAQSMVDLVFLNLNRKCINSEGISKDIIEENLDLWSFIRFLAAMMSINRGIKKAF